MEDRSLFISSCSRRDLARRRGHLGRMAGYRSLPPLTLAAIALVLAMAAIGAALLAAGTL